MAGQSRGKGKALNTIAARSGRDPAAIVDSIQAAEKAQAKADAAKQRCEAEAAAKDAAAAAAKKSEVGAKEHKEDGGDNVVDTTKDNEVSNNPSQIYSSLSPREQYQFQCFRRSGFASKPIEKFVAKMLVDESNRRFVTRRGAIVGLGGRFSGVGSNSSSSGNNNTGEYYANGGGAAATVSGGSDVDHYADHNTNNTKRKKQSKRQMLREESKRRRIAMDQPPPYLLSENVGNGDSVGNNSFAQVVIPPLDQLVVPNSASEIVAVVSTLAKSYAQRLVSAARRVADAEEEQKRRQVTTDTLTTKATMAQKPISPHHLLEAHRYRSRVGLDPGFWMADRVAVDGSRRTASSIRSSVGISEAAALGIEDRTRSCFIAALASQDAYDEVTKNPV